MKKLVAVFILLLGISCYADLASLVESKDAESRHARMAWFRLLPKQKVVIFDADGPGIITHFWTTIGQGLKEGSLVDPLKTGGTDFRDFIIRMYWDNEEHPSVEVPLSELFGCGFGIRQKHHSIVSAADGRGGFTTYWQMPFKKAAKIELYNNTDVTFPVYWNIDWEAYDELSEDTVYFHSYYNEDDVNVFDHHYIFEAEGKGHFTGLVYSVIPSTDKLWWGEGDEYFYIDGDADVTVRGTGTEDYFNQSWGIKPAMRLYTGFYEYDGNRKSMYRYHIKDPVHFKKSFRAEFEQLYGSLHRVDSLPHTKVASTAFWYQTEPHKPLASELPDADPIDKEFDVDIQKCHTLDITPAANMALKDEVAEDKKGGWTDQGKYMDLSPVPLGKNKMAGVPFDIKDKCAILHSTARTYFPKESKPLKIKDNASKVYFLIGTAWGQSFGLDPAGSAVMKYSDSSSEEYVFRMGKDLTDWFCGAPNKEMTSKPWHFTNVHGNRFNLYVVEWNNPYPDKQIEEIFFKCSGGKPVLGVVGVTLYQN